MAIASAGRSRETPSSSQRNQSFAEKHGVVVQYGLALVRTKDLFGELARLADSVESGRGRSP